MLEEVKKFLQLESAGGLLLLFAAILAMILANSPLSTYYDMLIEMPVEIRVGALYLAKPFLLWINDGLMAVFFFLVGLELKREVLEGELSSFSAVGLPAIGAAGGMAVPALIYLYFNGDNPVAAQGWAIPAATDIAFVMGILSLLGNRVPTSLKVFLVSLAIFDDIGAIIIIALFYSANLSLLALSIAATCLVGLFLLNRRGTTRLTPYLFLGLIMWVAVLKSGVHATLAGIALAMFIPLRDGEDVQSPLKALEHDLHGVVAFAILPLFAFANSGITLAGSGIDAMLHPVPIGIAAGLFLGKQLGVFGCCWLAVKLTGLKRPSGVTWLQFYGASLLCGVGFTMSLFIGSLAFQHTGVNQFFDERLGIIVGSLLSGIAGYVVLWLALGRGDGEPRRS